MAARFRGALCLLVGLVAVELVSSRLSVRGEGWLSNAGQGVSRARAKVDHCESINKIFARTWNAFALKHKKFGDLSTVENCQCSALRDFHRQTCDKEAWKAKDPAYIRKARSHACAAFASACQGTPVCLGLPKEGGRRVVSVADVHGDFKVMLKILQRLKLVDTRVTRGNWQAFSSPENSLWVGGNARLVQLGDVVDRGPGGRLMYQFLWALQDAAETRGGHVDLLIGNHELLLLQGQLDYVGTRARVLHGTHRVLALCSYVSTEGDCIARRAKGSYVCGDEAGRAERTPRRASECVQRAWDATGSMGSEVRTRLLRGRMKLAVQVGESIFVHAGLVPKLLETLRGATSPLQQLNARFAGLVNRSTSAQLNASSDITVTESEDGPAWTRIGWAATAPATQGGACSRVQQVLGSIPASRRMVIGHNALQKGVVVPACDGRLLLTDTMMSTAFWQHPIADEAELQAVEEFWESRLTAVETSDASGARIAAVQVGRFPEQKRMCVALAN